MSQSARSALLRRIKAELIDLRRLPNSDARWQKIHNGKMPTLAWCYAMPGQVWYGLARWERDIARLYVHALTAPKAILLDKAAAMILGIPVLFETEKYSVTLESNAVGSKGRGHFFAYVRTKLNREILEVEGVRVSSLGRTAIDIARRYGFAEGLVAMDYVRSQRVGRERLDSMLGAMGRVKGIAQARRAVKESVSNSESPWESYARGLLIEANIPGVKRISTQFEVERYRADLAVNGWLLIEIDGNVKYRYEPEEVISEEHRRQKALLNKGYVVMRYSPEELRRDPQGFVEAVRRQVQAGPRPLQRGGGSKEV
ncbi:endonuclease domain-containing protein [Corynebacterium sp.]|uniref:endonuclease domain-containing protein n=1 Tax=Corynebacterium sp. TaxID=1720 RepID=UPI0026DD6FD8|nr:DUF559 domain-containing protein [Corynebacterium sp.]MDO5031039.1 DUF559 domain-containing protein [Corynebacterium sp.]